MSYNRTNIFNDQLSISKNSFRVARKWRTNPLSQTPGGFFVKVVYKDGSSRIYDNVKNVEAYITYIIRNSEDDILEVAEYK